MLLWEYRALSRATAALLVTRARGWEVSWDLIMLDSRCLHDCGGNMYL